MQQQNTNRTSPTKEEREWRPRLFDDYSMNWDWNSSLVKVLAARDANREKRTNTHNKTRYHHARIMEAASEETSCS